MSPNAQQVSWGGGGGVDDLRLLFEVLISGTARYYNILLKHDKQEHNIILLFLGFGGRDTSVWRHELMPAPKNDLPVIREHSITSTQQKQATDSYWGLKGLPKRNLPKCVEPKPSILQS